MAFLCEFTSQKLACYEEKLKEGVYVIPKEALGNFQEWYILERNQQILFRKIQKLAEIFSRAIPVEEPSIPGIEGGWREWTTLSTNQRKLSVALDYLIAERKCFKLSPCSVIVDTRVSNESTPIVGCVIGCGTPGCRQEFTSDRLHYYEEQLKNGVFVIPKPLGNWQEWYILERNQQILFQKIKMLAEVFPPLIVIPTQQPSILGLEGCWREWATLSANQRYLSEALDHLLKIFKQPPTCIPCIPRAG